MAFVLIFSLLCFCTLFGSLQLMQLYLDSYGAFLGVENGMFWFKPKHSEGRAIACQRINCIFLTKGVRISSDAILLALSHNIPMVFTDQLGRSQGYLWSGQYGSISTVRKNKPALPTIRWVWIGCETNCSKGPKINSGP